MSPNIIVANPTFQFFSFFDTEDPDISGDMAVDFQPNRCFRVGEIRAAFSGVCSNDIYLRAYLSSVQGVVHNTLLLSYFLNNSQYYRWEPSCVPMLFLSGDTIQVSCITDNTWSLNISGWAANNVT